MRARILDFLAEHHAMTLATAGPGPHAAAVMYAHREFALYWVSDPETRHSHEIVMAGEIAATINPDYDDFTKIRGLQLSGPAAMLEGREAAEGLAELARKFPFFEQFAGAGGKLSGALAKARVWRFDPTRIVYIDNTRGFGFKETLELG
jgi:hypothetical protein